MQSMTFDPATADIGAQLSDSAYQGLQAGTRASNIMSSLLPAGGEEVSAQAVSAFASEAAQLVALNRAAQEELMRAGTMISEIARMYSEVDAAAATSVAGIGLHWGSTMAAR